MPRTRRWIRPVLEEWAAPRPAPHPRSFDEAYLGVLTRWGQILEESHPYTQGHSKRVAVYACRLARVTGLDDTHVRWLRIGALLHDVGKSLVPLELLNHDGPLSDEQWRVMRRHPAIGVELLSSFDLPWEVFPIVRHHHERYDGMGYPDRIAGQDIPLHARLLTIADIYDALTTTRSYRPAHTHIEALRIMRAERGRTVDPELFDVFDRIVAPSLCA